MSILSIEEDEFGNLFVPLSDELLKEVGWKIGDTIEWIDNKDGSFSLKKKVPGKLILVETISYFRQRYVVPEGTNLDNINFYELKEFSQKHIDERMMSSREISLEEVVKICDEDNEYCSTWTEDQKIRTFVNN